LTSTGTPRCPASTRSASAPARDCTAESAGGERPAAAEWKFDPPTEATRDAVWRYAGPTRNPDDLARLISNPYPLTRAIATAALDRRESRGGHLRSDCPGPDPALDGVHVVLAADGTVRHEEWD
jgi:hypothetical protein